MIAAILQAITLLAIIDAIAWVIALYNGISSLKIVARNREKLEKHYRKTKARQRKTSVSVIIPFRNEPLVRKTIATTMAQNIDSLEVIVVDDNSGSEYMDKIKDFIVKRTMGKEIAYVRLYGVPRDWYPKSYACYIGYRSSIGETLFFIDSDTWFLKNDVVDKLCSYASSSKSIVSIMPRFKCCSRRCRIVETVLTTVSHGFLGFNKVSSPRHRLAWFFGCCWCIDRRLYEQLGTHRLVRKSIVEDRDLGEQAKARGIPIEVVYGVDLVETMWYPSISDTVNVLSRILCRHTLKRKAYASLILLATGYYAPLLCILLGALTFSQLAIIVGVTAYLIQCITHGIGVYVNKYNPLYIFVAPLFGYILVAGIAKALRNKVFTWKNRVYYITSNKEDKNNIALKHRL